MVKKWRVLTPEGLTHSFLTRQEERCMAVLEAREVTKSFAEGKHAVQVLKGCTLAVERGEIVSLEGPSGSGKTTLLSILGCILTASSGSVSIEGKAVDSNDPALLPAVRRKSIG